MADAVDLLRINDITVMRTLDPEDILADWKDTKLLARVLIDDELLDETEPCLPIIYEGVSARPVTRWELGSFQVPTDCPVFTLLITTTGRFQIFCFQIQRGWDGMWNTGNIKCQEIYLGFRAQVLLCHPPTRFHQGCHTTPGGGVIEWDIPPAEPWDERIGPLHWLLDSLPAEQLLNLGIEHYVQSQFSPGDNGHLKHAIAAFERALEDPNIDPGLSQVLEITIPFLHCLEQGHSSCLDVALQIVQTFPGLPNAQLRAQLFLQAVVLSVVKRFEWHDYIPLAIKSITAPLKLLLHSASPSTWNQFMLYIRFAYNRTPNAKEVLPLMDLVVDFYSGFPTSEGFESLPMMRAIVYFMQAVKPGGPSLCMTLEAAEFVMRSLATAREHSLRLEFVRRSTIWLLAITARNITAGPNWRYRDRLLSFIAWRSSHLPLPEDMHRLRMIQSRLRGTPICVSDKVKMFMSQATILDDNDNQFIEEIYRDLHLQTRGKEIFAEYPKGVAELARNFLIDVDSGLCRRVTQSSCEAAAIIARALRLPEAFKVYELFMGLLGETRLGTLGLCVQPLREPSITCLVIRDAISCASETGNHALALQWSDQRCSEIWNWLFHSRLSIGQLSATEPILARTLKARPPWMDSWAKLKSYDPVDDKNDYMKLPGYNLVPGLERFWRPKTPAEITSLAEVLGGPIVYLNVNRYSSQALAVLPGLDDVVHIPLPDLDNIPMLHALSVEFMKSPQTFLQEGSSIERLWERQGFKVNAPEWQQPTPSVRYPAVRFLAYLWHTVVKPVLDGLGIQHAQKATADMPRIWWCPSGPLIGLPIHAAGIYTDDGQGPVISDYVVSSYFPSASALAYATRPEDPSQKFSLLTIANPTGAGLPGTEWELEKIKMRTTTQELTRGEATVEAVKKGMENTSWAHFACHGVTNPDKPWESALILANHTRLTLREISDMSLPHAEFAYLSACQTAKGVVEEPDQSAHLSAGMLACGYRSVVGTLWKISDEYAPFVADRVYAKMLEGGQPDYKRAAYALHDAVQALRKEPGVGFHTWLPFIHVGV